MLNSNQDLSKIKTIFFLITIVCCSSCLNKNEQNKKVAEDHAPNTYITGTITNAKDPNIRLFSTNIKDTILLNNSGAFLIPLHLQKPQYMQLITKTKTISLFASPGDSLIINYSEEYKNAAVNIEGIGCHESQYLKSKQYLMLDMAIPLAHLFEYPSKQFKFIVDSTYIVHKINLAAFIEKYPETSATFIKHESASILYDRATTMYEYLQSSRYKHQINASFLAFEKGINPNDSSLMEVYEYKSYLKAMLSAKAKQSLQKKQNIHYSPQELTLARLQQCSRLISNPYIKNYLYFYFLTEHVNYYGYKQIENIMQTFSLQCTNDSLKNVILTPYNKFNSLTDKKTAPFFEFFNNDNQKYTINSFKGSYVYIDVWATWCLPCRKLAPYFEELADKNKHKNIVFISLSVDKNEKDWTEYLIKKNKSQHQYIVRDIEQFVEDYQIKTIPHFLLINPDGKLIDANAPRPTDKDDSWIKNIQNK